MTLVYRTDDNTFYEEPVSLEDKEGYVEALLSFLPDNIKKYYSEDKIRQYGLNKWGKDNTFNTYDIMNEIKAANIDFSNASIFIGYDKKGNRIFEQAGAAFSQASNDSDLASVTNSYFSKINRDSKSGMGTVIPATASEVTKDISAGKQIKGLSIKSNAPYVAKIEFFGPKSVKNEISRDFSQIIAKATNGQIDSGNILSEIKGITETLQGRLKKGKSNLRSFFFVMDGTNFPISDVEDKESRENLESIKK